MQLINAKFPVPTRTRWAVLVTLSVVCGSGCRSERASSEGDTGQTGAAKAPPSSPAEVPLTPELVAKVNRGVALMGRFQYAKAAELFAELAEQFPEWAEAHINLALAQLNEDQGGQRAEPTLAKVLKIHPDHVAANYCMGVVLVHGSHTAAALPYLEKVYAADARDAYVAYLLGLCAEETSKEKALEWYDKTTTLDPMFLTAHYRRKVLLQLSGQPEKAAEALARFQDLRLCPTAKSFQFKYTLMGSKALAIPAGDPPAKQAAPQGPAFAAAQPLLERAAPLPVNGGATITACDLDGDDRCDLYLTGTRSTDSGTAGAILWQQPDGSFREDTEHPLAKISEVTAAVWGDFNDDGLTDGYFCRADRTRCGGKARKASGRM